MLRIGGGSRSMVVVRPSEHRRGRFKMYYISRWSVAGRRIRCPQFVDCICM